MNKMRSSLLDTLRQVRSLGVGLLRITARVRLCLGLGLELGLGLGLAIQGRVSVQPSPRFLPALLTERSAAGCSSCRGC